MGKPITPLKRAIFESGRTQKDVAQAVGISEKQLSLIANGLHAEERTQELLATELRQSRDDLFPAVRPVAPFGEAA